MRLHEERMLTIAASVIAVAGFLAAITGGLGMAIVLAFVVNFSASIGRLAFDSIVQRDAPDANQGRAFAQFETRFQLAWVLAGAAAGGVHAAGLGGLPRGRPHRCRRRGHLRRGQSRTARAGPQRTPAAAATPSPVSAARVASRSTEQGEVASAAPATSLSRARIRGFVSSRNVRRSSDDRLELEAGDPEAGGVELGRRGQRLWLRAKQLGEAGLADAIDHAGGERLAALHLLVA